MTSVDTVRDFFRFLTETPDRAFEDGFRPLWRTLKNREQMRLLVPELLPGAEMARTEGTVDTVELKRNQSYFQALFRMRVPKRKEHRVELPSGTLRSKSGHWKQFAAAVQTAAIRKAAVPRHRKFR